ncbi:MAG: lytic transglycosylase domain-containing protein [Treponema sp.]|nr:lytic transglycosylase domain-containing protein [Treponema sp.]
MKKKHVHSAFSLILLALLMCTTLTCHAGNRTSKYGDDAFYFEALKALENKDKGKASSLLKKSVRNGSPLVARLSAEELVEISSGREKLYAAESLYKTYGDRKSLGVYAEALFENNSFAQLLDLTKDMEDEDDDVTLYRMMALLETDSESFSDSFHRWCTTTPYSARHHTVFGLIQEATDNDSIFSSPAARLRESVYTRDWGTAAKMVSTVCSDSQNIRPQILSDAGKAFLYGSKDYEKNAAYLSTLEKDASPDSKFFLAFYRGRLLDKTETNNTQASQAFLTAMENAQSPEQFDNALWYYLNTALKDSIASALFELSIYRSQWNDPAYFDDFLDTLSLRLITKHLWQEYYNTAVLIDGYASNEATAKFSYVAGSLIENKFLTPKTFSAKQAYTTLYSRALNSETNIYHKFLAAEKLGLTKDEVLQNLETLHIDENFTRDEEAEHVLEGYVDFEIPSRVYPFWNEHSTSISMETTHKASRYLQVCGADDPSYFTLSLRIASRKAHSSEGPVSEDIMSLAFPRDFQPEVKKWCTEYKIDEYLAYALIRSESFFDPQVTSWAGATGLTQLMAPTAGDIAAKLKVKDYDLTDINTNLQFGIYYLSELTRRLDGNKLQAVFSYNAGIGRIRQLLKTAKIEFEKNSIPEDIFLEALPIQETRDYGRKIVGASAMYAMLYYDKDPSEIIKDFMEN